MIFLKIWQLELVYFGFGDLELIIKVKFDRYLEPMKILLLLML